MFNLFNRKPPSLTAFIKLGKRNTVKISMINNKNNKPYGGEIVCLKFGHLEQTMKRLQACNNYDIVNIVYLTGGQNVKAK